MSMTDEMHVYLLKQGVYRWVSVIASAVQSTLRL